MRYTHILMRTFKFDGYFERKEDYCKVRFSEGDMKDKWEISQRRMDSEDKDCSSVGLASEFQVLLYSL